MPRAYLPLLLALLTMVGPLGIDAYLPAFLAIESSLETSSLAVQQTLSVYLVTMSVMVLFYGALVDSFGRKRVLRIAMLGFAVSSVAAICAWNVGLLILARAAQGVFAGAGMVVSRTIVQDLYKGAEAQRVMATMTMVFGVAPALGPILGGGLLTVFGWRAIFVFLAGFSLLLWWASGKWLRETLPPSQRQLFVPTVILANYAKAFAHPVFMLRVLAIGFVFGGVSLYIGSASAFIIGILGLSETDFGWLFIPMVTGMTLGAASARRWSRRVTPGKLVRIGFIMMFLSALISVTVTLMMTPRVPWAVLPLGLYSFGIALSMPSLTLSALTLFPSNRGMASSMQSFTQMMVFAILSGALAPLLFDSAVKLALGHLLTLAVAGLLWRWSRQLERQREVRQAQAPGSGHE